MSRSLLAHCGTKGRRASLCIDAEDEYTEHGASEGLELLAGAECPDSFTSPSITLCILAVLSAHRMRSFFFRPSLLWK
ncbi:hypothetical protein VZT92_009864 [Zoarces viviparus]|uniref:Uncharacterized protein n=1 Tax=Zoarces viviparus TaxID=48416 RepID=A0AAW1FCB7_ZOAVI